MKSLFETFICPKSLLQNVERIYKIGGLRKKEKKISYRAVSLVNYNL